MWDKTLSQSECMVQGTKPIKMYGMRYKELESREYELEIYCGEFSPKFKCPSQEQNTNSFKYPNDNCGLFLGSLGHYQGSRLRRPSRLYTRYFRFGREFRLSVCPSGRDFYVCFRRKFRLVVPLGSVDMHTIYI